MGYVQCITKVAALSILHLGRLEFMLCMVCVVLQSVLKQKMSMQQWRSALYLLLLPMVSCIFIEFLVFLLLLLVA